MPLQLSFWVSSLTSLLLKEIIRLFCSCISGSKLMVFFSQVRFLTQEIASWPWSPLALVLEPAAASPPWPLLCPWLAGLHYPPDTIFPMLSTWCVPHKIPKLPPVPTGLYLWVHWQPSNPSDYWHASFRQSNPLRRQCFVMCPQMVCFARLLCDTKQELNIIFWLE